jgi:hypothetical protein
MAKAGIPKSLIGIVFLIVGAGLMYWGYQESGGLDSKIESALTGSHSDNVMMMYIGGSVCLAIGVFFAFRK